MNKGLFADASPFTQIIMLLFSMLACFLLLIFTGILFIPIVMGIPITELMTVLNGRAMDQYLNLMRYLQVLQGISLFIVPAFFASYLFSGTATGYLSLGQTVSVKWFGAVLLLAIAAMPCINLLAALNEMIVFPQSMSGLEQRLRSFEEAARQTTELFLNVDNAGGMLFNIFMIAVLPALGEEFIFRGVLQKIFARWTGNQHVAILVTGFLFSLMHMQFYGLIPRWLLGVMFGYLLVWSGTLWLPVFAHFVHNAVAVFLSYLVQQGTIAETIEEFGASWRDIPVTFLLTAICVWLLWTIKTKNVKEVCVENQESPFTFLS